MSLCALFAAVLSACGGGTTSDIAEAAATDVTALRAPSKVTLATTLATEGDSFKVSGVQLVTFGADSGWVQKSVAGNGQCTTSFFGSDPAPGATKTWQVAQDSEPPHSATMPGTPLRTAVSITESPTLACTVRDSPAWSV